MIQDTIKQRLRASLLASTSSKTILDAAAHLSAEQNDAGGWEDLDASGTPPPGSGKTDHLQRTLLLAQARHLAPAELGGPLARAFDWWLSRDPRQPDPHRQEITVPRQVGEIALLCDDELSLGAAAKAVEILARSRWAYWEPGEGWAEWGGGTMLAVAYNVLLRSCLEKSVFLCETAFRRAFRNVRWTLPNALEVPAHLERHPSTPQPIDGVTLTQDYSRLTALAYGTPWQAPVESTRAFVSYLLDYQQWTVRQGVPALSVGGALPNGPDWAAVAEGIMQLAQLGNPPRRLELVALAERLAGKGQPLSGHRLFRRLQLAVHHRPSFYACLRVGTPTRFHQEAAPADAPATTGTMYLLRSGQEYKGMTHRWNHQQLPGMTAVQSAALTRQAEPATPSARMFGGLSEGDYGLAARELSEGGLWGRKAWFFFDGSVACLDAGLQGPPAREPVFTTVNQCRLRGPVVVENASRQRRLLTPGSLAEDLTGIRHVEHDGFLYYFPGSLHIGASLATTPDERGPGFASEEPVFTLWINHGFKPAGASSAYLAIPASDPAVDGHSVEREISMVEMVSNTPAVQGVRHREAAVLALAFWEPGVVKLPEGGRVAANRPCLMLCRETAPGHVTMTLGNLTRQAATVHVEHNGRCLAFDLPGDQDIGRSVSQRL